MFDRQTSGLVGYVISNLDFQYLTLLRFIQYVRMNMNLMKQYG